MVARAEKARSLEICIFLESSGGDGMVWLSKGADLMYLERVFGKKASLVGEAVKDVDYEQHGSQVIGR